MFGLLSKKKKFSAVCDLSRSPLQRETAYVLSTAQIISSKKFWDNIMTEPETMTYTEAFFKTGDSTATNIRHMIFKKYAATDKAWVVSDAHIHLFEVDREEAKQIANRWWDSEGKELPAQLSVSVSNMDEAEFEQIKTYALQEAGRSRVRV